MSGTWSFLTVSHRNNERGKHSKTKTRESAGKKEDMLLERVWQRRGWGQDGDRMGAGWAGWGGSLTHSSWALCQPGLWAHRPTVWTHFLTRICHNLFLIFKAVTWPTELHLRYLYTYRSSHVHKDPPTYSNSLMCVWRGFDGQKKFDYHNLILKMAPTPSPPLRTTSSTFLQIPDTTLMFVFLQDIIIILHWVMSCGKHWALMVKFRLVVSMFFSGKWPK